MSSREGSEILGAQGGLSNVDPGNPSSDKQDLQSTDHHAEQLRLRTLTERGLDQFESRCQHFTDKLINYTRDIQQIVTDFSVGEVDISHSSQLRERLESLYADYNKCYIDYYTYLTASRTELSLEKRTSVESMNRTVSNEVRVTLQKMSMLTETCLETRSCTKTLSSKHSSTSSTSSSQLARHKAKVEGAKARLAYEKQQLTIKKERARLEEEELKSKASVERKKTELELSLDLLKKESEAAVAEAEYEAFREVIAGEECYAERSLPLPKVDKIEQTRLFVQQNSLNDNKVDLSQHKQSKAAKMTEINDNTGEIKVLLPAQAGQAVDQNTCNSSVPNQLNPNSKVFIPASQPLSSNTQDIANYLIKRDLLVQRLTNFDDRPETFNVWKNTFCTIVRELCLTPTEEFDLLLKWLGPESKKFAVSLRSSNPSDPAKGLQRLWGRLYERYGAPEMLESALKKKLQLFPKLTNKDSKKLYELSDLLSEIESCMEDDRYSALLSYFNTSSGVVPIVSKLSLQLQNKWTTRASKYKRTHGVVFPPFREFCDFIREMCSILNDPSFAYITDIRDLSGKNSMKPVFSTSSYKQTPVTVRKTGVNDEAQHSPVTVGNCPIHKTKHTLNQCKAFRNKSMGERKRLLRQHNICYKCCESDKHIFKNCAASVKCQVCGSASHPSALHFENRQFEQNEVTPQNYGRERASTSVQKFGHSVDTKCTSVCGNEFTGRSCGKIVLVKVHPANGTGIEKKMYAILDDQSNRTLARPEFFDIMKVPQNTSELYTLVSCAGTFQASGRHTQGFIVSTLDDSFSLELPKILECSDIPNSRSEIPTPEVTRHHAHLQSVPIHELDHGSDILLLIGRDLPEAHHVFEQLIGPKDSPFAQRLGLGWVVIGDVCTGKIHKPDRVSVLKTRILDDGRPTILPQCDHKFVVKQTSCSLENPHDDLFRIAKDDNKPGMSIEDKDFLKIMDDEFRKDENNHWSAPLPFRNPRQRLPNNRSQALKRATILDQSLRKDVVKRQHFIEFMARIFENDHAEVAPELRDSEECWYLPVFGVYHPKKKDQIRAVFDSSARFEGVSLNSVLLSGPDLINSLIGILMRFRKCAVGLTGDIQQMFYQFRVHERDRNYLRFFWYKNNDMTNDLIEYRMCVHVFGNSPSPAVAMYGLRKIAELSEESHGADVKSFINRDFYVDDGLTSLCSSEEAVCLMKRTQEAMYSEGQLKLHKIASNHINVLGAFPEEELDKTLKTFDLDCDTLPVQRSLGLSWNLQNDSFVFNVSDHKRTPFTKRGVLSTVNSLYDPLGFLAPVTIGGKLLLREIIASVDDWDKPLKADMSAKWESWLLSLQELTLLHIPRQYFPVDLTNPISTELHVFSDASENAIAAVAFLRDTDKHGQIHVGFAFGKSKVAPKHGHTIPRLELCAAVLAVEIAEIVSDELDIESSRIKYYSDSKVVLGYLQNKTRRFYIYVANRVSRILQFSSSDQWCYVPTEKNPADHGTRVMTPAYLQNCCWLTGEVLRESCENVQKNECFPLVSPEEDSEIRSEVVTCKTSVGESESLGTDRFTRFSDLERLCSAISLLTHVAVSFKLKKKDMINCQGWHVCKDCKSVDSKNHAMNFLIKQFQQEAYKKEIACLSDGKPVPRDSSILTLSPFLENDILRVGGRLNRTQLPENEKHPVLIPGGSHLALLIVRHYHTAVRHQGRHFTEGAVRAAGYWIIGGKKLINFVIHKCVKCRKLRGKLGQQRMADLPEDRITPAPPFTFVGVDVFGPWSVVTRRTRGGVATSKRWAVLFACQSTRAIHLELIEEMSSSSFINAVRRFYAIRGKVKEFRSDCGTNFVGATDALQVDAVNVEDGPLKELLYKSGTIWRFNPPHASHMGGSWERLIGVSRRVLDAVLMDNKNVPLTHEVLSTFLAEVMAIVNSRPLVPISTDADEPWILTPAMLLTQKSNSPEESYSDITIKDSYRVQWKQVQYLSDKFWSRWRREYVQNLQSRSKWHSELCNIQVGDVVLMRDKQCPRNEWPLGVVIRVFPSDDELVRKVELRVSTNGKTVSYIRPVTELVHLL